MMVRSRYGEQVQDYPSQKKKYGARAPYRHTFITKQMSHVNRTSHFVFLILVTQHWIFVHCQSAIW